MSLGNRFVESIITLTAVSVENIESSHLDSESELLVRGGEWQFPIPELQLLSRAVLDSTKS